MCTAIISKLQILHLLNVEFVSNDIDNDSSQLKPIS